MSLSAHSDPTPSSRSQTAETIQTRLLIVLPQGASDALADTADVLEQDHGFSVTRAFDVDDAIERVQEDEKFDLVIAELAALGDGVLLLLENCSEIYTRVIVIGPRSARNREYPPMITVHGFMEEPIAIEDMIDLMRDVLALRPRDIKRALQPLTPGTLATNRAVLRRGSSRSTTRMAPLEQPPSEVETAFAPPGFRAHPPTRVHTPTASTVMRSGMHTSQPGRDHGADVTRRLSVRQSSTRRAQPVRELTGAFGPYQVDRRLGAGAMGEVYLARHRLLELDVALKLLPLELAEDSNYVIRFHREARAGAKLDHPNIVRVINVGELDGRHFIAMQYVDGPTLRTVLEQSGVLDIAWALGALRQALSGLAYAHSKQCIHRDIKPDNLMVTSAGLLKVTDFGLARNLSAQEATLTHTGQVMGTPAYMPLEQWDGERVDHRADIFSVGVTFFHLLTGHLPYEGKTSGAILRNLTQGRATPLSTHRRDAPEQLGAILARMIARDADDRYQWTTEALDAVSELAPPGS